MYVHFERIDFWVVSKGLDSIQRDITDAGQGPNCPSTCLDCHCICLLTLIIEFCVFFCAAKHKSDESSSPQSHCFSSGLSMAVRVIVTLFHSLTAISQVIRASFQALHISARKVEWRRVITSMQICPDCKLTRAAKLCLLNLSATQTHPRPPSSPTNPCTRTTTTTAFDPQTLPSVKKTDLVCGPARADEPMGSLALWRKVSLAQHLVRFKSRASSPMSMIRVRTCLRFPIGMRITMVRGRVRNRIFTPSRMWRLYAWGLQC